MRRQRQRVFYDFLCSERRNAIYLAPTKYCPDTPRRPSRGRAWRVAGPPATELRVSCLRMLYCHSPRPSGALHVVSHRPSTAPTAARAAAAMCAARRRPPRAQPCRWRRGPWCVAAQRAIHPFVARSAHVVQCQEVGVGRVRGPRAEWREPRPSAVAAALPPRPRQGALGRAIRSAQEALANV